MRAVLFVLALAAVVAVYADSSLETNIVESKCGIAATVCKRDRDCCGGLRCNALISKCERICTKTGEKCKKDSDCCSASCRDGQCLCFGKGATCTWGDECCDGSCSATKGCCKIAASACLLDDECCSRKCQATNDSDAPPAKAGTPKKCFSGFGEKCSSDEQCTKPHYCSDLLGVCTLHVKPVKL